MGYVERHLLPDERVLYKTRLHWIQFWKPAAATIAGVALGGVLSAAQPTWLWLAGAAVALAGLGWGGVRWIELWTSEFAVTSSRLIFKVGLVARYTTELLLSKVESIGVSQGLIGRLLGFGDLTVTGSGGVREVFRRVNDPIGFRMHVQQASLESEGRAGPRPSQDPPRGTRAD